MNPLCDDVRRGKVRALPFKVVSAGRTLKIQAHHSALHERARLSALNFVAAVCRRASYRSWRVARGS